MNVHAGALKRAYSQTHAHAQPIPMHAACDFGKRKESEQQFAVETSIGQNTQNAKFVPACQCFWGPTVCLIGGA